MTTSRRELLKLGGSLAALPALDGLRWLSDDSFSFAFFSDTHVGLKNNVAEDASMMREMRDLGFDFAINGGDVTDYGWVGEYRNWQELMKLVPFPIHHVPGNHDVRWSPLGPKAYKEGTRSPMFESFDHKGVHFALLDSTVPLSHWGHFESAMLRWLEKDLAGVGRQNPVFVVTHHWVGRDGIMVDNEEVLLKIIEPYNVKIILNAHGHSDLLWTWHGIPNTMNRGLYQLSYQRVDVDRTRNEVRLSRRTKEKPTQSLLTTVPLTTPRTRVDVWKVPERLSAGVVLKPRGFAEYRWDDGKWKPVGDGIVVAQMASGPHRLSLRTDVAYATAGHAIADGGDSLGIAWETKLPGGVMSHLKLHGGHLLVSTMDGSLLKVEKSRGNIVWQVHLGDYCHSSPVVVGDIVVVGSADGFVHARKLSDGKPVWIFHTDGPVYASAASGKGVVAIASGDGRIYGLDERTGVEKWRYVLPASNSAFIQSQGASDGERVYFGAWDSHLYALNLLDGGLVFRAGCCDDRSFAYSPAIGGPTLGDGRVYVPANGNVMYGFDAKTGEPRWQTKSPGDKFGYSAPSFFDGKVIAGNLGDKGEVRCVDAKSGQILWTAETGSVIYDSSPKVFGRWAAVGSVSGLLSLIYVPDGRVMRQNHLPVGHFLSSPEIDADHVYAATYNDRLIALTLPKAG